MQRATFSQIFMWLFLGCAVIAYTSPWVTNQNTGLTLNAYDLAEWMNLHPVSRSTQPVLWHTFLLRVQLVIIAVLIALQTPRPLFTRQWWLRSASILLLVIAQLPPMEFLQNTSDINQQQQFALTIATLLLSMMALWGLFSKYRLSLTLGLSVLGLTSSVTGVYTAQAFMRDFNLQTGVGFGAVLFACVFSMIIIYAAYTYHKDRQSRL